MTDYTQNTTFTTKDALTTGDPNKVIYGADLDGEFGELATAIASKANRPASAATANFAGFVDTSGNLADSGKAIPTGVVVGNSDSQTLTTKTIDLADNTLTGTTAQFNTALSDGSFATLAGSEILTAKTLTSPAINGATIDVTSTIAGITASNLLDRTQAESVSGDWAFTGTLDLNDQTSKVVMMATPEALTMTTTGAWTGVAPTATTGNASVLALIIKVRLRGNAFFNDTSGGPGTATYSMAVRADVGDGEYTVADLYWSTISSSDTGNLPQTDTGIATVKADGNGDFDYYLTSNASITEVTLNNTSVSAHLIGYILAV